MARAKKPVPLIKQSLEQIVAAARLGGFNAAKDRKSIESRFDLRVSWFDENLPSAPGLMDDDAFCNVLDAAAEAFEEGVESYLTAQKQESMGDGPADTKAKQRAALENAQNDGESFDIKQILSFALSVYTETLPEMYEGQSEEDFDAFVLEAMAEFKRSFNRAFSQQATRERLSEIADDGRIVSAMLAEIRGVFKAVARLEDKAEVEHRDSEIAALASVGASLCHDAAGIIDRGIVGLATMDAHAPLAQTERPPEHADA